MTATERQDEVLSAVVCAHKNVIAAVTPGHPNCLLRDRDAYERVFSAWHKACDDAARVLDWPHRDEVVREAGKEASAIQ